MKSARILCYTILVSTLFSPTSFASNAPDDEVSLTIKAPASSDLGQLIIGMSGDVYALEFPLLERAIAQGYKPATDESSVLDLFNQYVLKGDYDSYQAAVQKLCDRGNPVAWSVIGSQLAQNNMASKNGDYHKGMHLLKKASITGVSIASNNIGMLLWYEKKLDEAASYFKSGLSNPHDTVNYAYCLKEQGSPDSKYIPFYMMGTEAGSSCGASALGDYYAKKRPSIEGEALKWYLISYKGPRAMDFFNGFEDIIQFMSNTTFLPGQVESVQAEAKTWMMTHPQIYMDGFDLMRLSLRVTKGGSVSSQPEVTVSNVLDCFWNYYAPGDKITFAASLIPFLKAGDANAMFMQAHMDRGFVGEPNPQMRRDLLQICVAKQHPLAYLELALDLWVEGALAPDQADKLDCYTKAYGLLMDGYNRWYNTPHRNVIGEIVFFLGYFNENGIGLKEKNPTAASQYFQQAFELTLLSPGYLGRYETDPVKAGAYLLMARCSFTLGDWFNGIHNWQKKYALLTPEQRIQAQEMATSLLNQYPLLKNNTYQTMAAGLHPDFAAVDVHKE